MRIQQQYAIKILIKNGQILPQNQTIKKYVNTQIPFFEQVAFLAPFLHYFTQFICMTIESQFRYFIMEFEFHYFKKLNPQKV